MPIVVRAIAWSVALGALLGTSVRAAQGPCGVHQVVSQSPTTRSRVALDREHLIVSDRALATGLPGSWPIRTFVRDPQTGALTAGPSITAPLGVVTRFGAEIDVDHGRLAVASSPPLGVLIYRYVAPSWVLEQSLTSVDVPTRPRTGLVLHGDLLLVTTNAGIEAWERDPATNVWALAQFIPPQPNSSAMFGEDIDFDGRALVVGDRLAGQVSLYRRNFDGSYAWLQDIARSLPSSSTMGRFGAQVELEDLLLVVAREATFPSQALEVFRYVPSTGGWALAQLVQPPPLAMTPSGGIDDYFGDSLSLSRGTLVVSAPRTRVTSGSAIDGAVVIFKEQPGSRSFRLERTLLGNAAGTAVPGNLLGRDLAYDEGLLALSHAQLGLTNVGYYVLAPGTTDCDLDGTSDACQILLGQRFDDNHNGFVDSCELVGQRYCGPATPNSTGSAARMNVFGDTRVLVFSIELVVSGVPPGAIGTFLASRQNQVVSNPGGSLGDLCLAGAPIARGLGGVRAAGADGRISVSYNRPAVALPAGLAPILPGQTWYFQCWYQDPGAVPRANFSDAMGVLFTFL